MTSRTVLLASPLVLALGLAACDGRDAEVAALSEEISAIQAELDSALDENRRLEAELEELRARTEAAGGGAGSAMVEGDGGAMTGGAPAGGGATAGGAGGVLGEAVRGELQVMTEKLEVALADLEAADAAAADADLADVRRRLGEVVETAETILTVVGAPQVPAPDAPAAPAGVTPEEAPPEVLEEVPLGEEPAPQ